MLQQQEHATSRGGLRRETVIAADATPEARRDFIQQTYIHLFVAVVAFIGLEYLLIDSSIGRRWMELTLGSGRFGWLLVLGGFILVSWLAEKWASSERSPGLQYLGLTVYVIAEAFIFLPLLYVAASYARYEGVIAQAGWITAIVFAGLTAIVFISKRDFSWMRPLLYTSGLVALGVIVVSLLFGFTLGTFFCGLMVLLAAGYILYHTSNVLHHYHIGSHVAASLALFSSVALLFWYVLRILMSRR